LKLNWYNKNNVANVQIYNPVKDKWFKGTPTPNSNNYKVFGGSGTIIGDTIYYFGGASFGKHFPSKSVLRIGFIDKNNQTKIVWKDTILPQKFRGYRMACAKINGIPFWFGGSLKTYNYNGVAYDGSGGVSPSNQLFYFKNRKMYKINLDLPMDLRGIASFNDSIKYIIGGMTNNQKVSNKIFKLVYKKSK